MYHSNHWTSVVGTVVILLAMPAGAVAESGPPRLDKFLSGLTECSFTREFEIFRDDVFKRFSNAAWTTNPVINDSVRVSVPAELASSIDIANATVRSGGELTGVSIPVRGSLNGLPVKSFGFALGNQNGIWVFAVEFATDRAAVVQKFDSAIRRGQALLKKNADGIEFAVGFAKPPAATIFCDQSN